MEIDLQSKGEDTIMASKNIATFGIYPDQISAGEAADDLKRIGFRATDISILVPDNVGTKDFGHERRSKAPEGATLGAVAGALAGAGLGWLVSAGNFSSVPWLDQFKALGALGAVLSGIGAVTILGLFIGGLIGSGFPMYEAIRYEGRTRKGGVLLSAHCDNPDWTRRAKEILRQTGAKQMGVMREAKADFGASEKPMARTRTAAVLDNLHRDRDHMIRDHVDPNRETAELHREELEPHEPVAGGNSGSSADRVKH
jgi:hypothetical protein